MKQRILMILFTVAVTVAFIAPISFLYLLTQKKVTENEKVFVIKAVLNAADIPLPGTNEEVISLFSSRVKESGDAAAPVYRITGDAGETAGFVITQTGPGLWGEIALVAGFEADRARLTGLDFLKQSETPGLGARISETWFKEQFRGKRGPFTMVAEGEPAEENQFDAITGATVTSKAVMAIVNGAVEAARIIPE